MKLMSRDFTLKEKILILVLVLVLVVLAYYKFVDEPVREALDKAASEKAGLEDEYTIAQARLTQLQKMQSEIDKASSSATFHPMPSYNNKQAIYLFLNDVLGSLDGIINFPDIKKEENLIRRTVTIQFTAPDYDTVSNVLNEIANCEFRCLIGDVQCSSKNKDISVGQITVNTTVTFYETMAGGQVDAGVQDK